jgi:hypothetical protein
MIGVGEWAPFGTNAFSEQGNDLGIERIGRAAPRHEPIGQICDLAVEEEGARTPHSPHHSPLGRPILRSARHKLLKLLASPRGCESMLPP